MLNQQQEAIPPSRLERIARSTSYLVAGIAGIALLVNAPATIQNGVLLGVSIAVGIFLMSGFVAALGAFGYRYRIEYFCLPMIGSALLVYVVCIWAWVFAHGTGVFIALLATVLLLKLCARFAALQRLVGSHKLRGG